MPRVQYNRLQNIINRIVYRPYSIDINFNGDNVSLRLNGHKQIKSSAYYRPNLMDIDIYFLIRQTIYLRDIDSYYGATLSRFGGSGFCAF